jgi:hypothetical protein
MKSQTPSDTTRMSCSSFDQCLGICGSSGRCPLTDDAGNDFVMALALSSGAMYFVTGDHALQRWRSDKVAAVSPREFLEYLKGM